MSAGITAYPVSSAGSLPSSGILFNAKIGNPLPSLLFTTRLCHIKTKATTTTTTATMAEATIIQLTFLVSDASCLGEGFVFAVDSFRVLCVVDVDDGSIGVVD